MFKFFPLCNLFLKKMTEKPLIVILGATGSGKTKLSLSLATKFNAEIIGADSMQIYKGLDIATAKATKEEQRIAPHHLIDILQPHETFTVVDYRNRALRIIDDLHARNKLPIIVGGTNYYIESLLWKILVENKTKVWTPGILPNDEHELSSEALHEKLKELDPLMAARLHPNNKRKILRSLEVFYQTGRKHSDILTEQQTSAGGSRSGGALRYQNVVILWLQCDLAILDDRLNKRVDSMIEQGLLDELRDFHRLYNEERIKNDPEPDYTRGVFQSIGFKEFHEYLLLPDEKLNSEEAEIFLRRGIDELKTATRRYARKQMRWITNRFLARIDRQVPPLYGLPTDDVTKFDENVIEPALEIVKSFLNCEPCDHRPLPRTYSAGFPNSGDDTHRCEVCDRIFVGEHQWSIHLKSAKHKTMLAKRKKSEEAETESERS